MPSSSTFPLVDRLLGGRLLETLQTWQAEGLSLHAMSIRLREEHQITVTPNTIARWLRTEQAAS